MGSKKEELIKIGAALAGCLIYVLGVKLFLVPMELYSGGLLGIAQLLRSVINMATGSDPGFDISGIIYYALNIPIFVLAFRQLQKRIVIKTLVCATLVTVVLSFVPSPGIPILEERLANCLAAGIMSGIGIGLVFYGSASMGGMDLVSLVVIQKNKNFSAGKVSLIINIFLYIACGVIFEIGTAVYSVIVAAFCSLVMDRIHYQNIDQEIKVITEHLTDEMKAEIMTKMGRGITVIPAKGAYTDSDREVLLITVSKYESAHLKQVIKELDPHAFIVENDRVHITGNYKKKL